MANTIAHRIADFLVKHPPFGFLNAKELDRISDAALVEFAPRGRILFKKGDAPKSHFYVVAQGAIALSQSEEKEDHLIDLCDEGDLFGLRPLLVGDPYLLTASANENTLLYLIPNKLAEKILMENGKAAFFLASALASGTIVLPENETADPTDHINGIAGNQLMETLPFSKRQKVVSTNSSSTVQKAAAVMQAADVGSIIIIDQNNHPIGIITDTDLRNKVATGLYPLRTPVTELMSSPVICLPPDAPLAEIQMEMIKQKVHHLCLTKDGTVNSPVQRIVSEHDLLVLQGNSPAILVREIRKSKSTARLHNLRQKAEVLLGKYLAQEIAISFIAGVMSEINDAIIKRCIDLAKLEISIEALQIIDKHPFCWLSLGSEGREEQLLRTDQDNALIFKDTTTLSHPETKASFLALAKKTNDLLHQSGFEYCPADMMAGNPKWCLSASEWQRQFEKWINAPGEKEIMHTTIFFDYRPVYGDFQLAHNLTTSIFELLDKKEIFLSFLAKDALKSPAPLGFFRNFIVERNGEHKNEFDIKARAMMPLVDAARILILYHRRTGTNNTFKRFDLLAELEPKNKELYEQAADAYELLMRLRAQQGLANQDTGRFFPPDQLNKTQRILLRNSFLPINDLQQILKLRFQTNYFG